MNKKYYPIIGIFIAAILAYFGYDNFLNKEVIKLPPIVIDQCDPSNYINDNTATKFIVITTSPQLIRRNFNSLPLVEQLIIDSAIRKMKSLPSTDPTSYAFQARIHNGPIDSADLTKPFKTCQHNDCCFFLAWHRMYIYFFERIMRSKMNPAGARPALPYWDFQNYNIAAAGNTAAISGSIPRMFRDTTSALFDSKRNPVFNKLTAGQVINSGYRTTAFNTSIANTSAPITYNYNFFDFQNSIYNAHGNIHLSIGKWFDNATNTLKVGDLGELTTAANDPLFFVLHANVDRLWEKWLKAKPQQNMNPNNGCNKYWMDRQFVFYDETGRKVFLTGADILNTANSTLNYKYDNVAVPTQQTRNCTKSSQKCDTFPKVKMFTETTNVNIQNNFTKIYTNNFSLSPYLKNTIASNPNAAFTFEYNTYNGDNIYFEMSKITTTRIPDGAVEIYIAENETYLVQLEPQNKSFAGIISLFDLQSTPMHKNVQRINITNVVKEQGLKLASLKNLKIVFVTRGHILDGMEVPTEVSLRIGELKIAVYKNKELVGN